MLADLDALTVRVVGEGGDDFGTYRFDDLRGSTSLLRSLVEGFAAAAGPGGRWRSQASARTGNAILRRLYRDLQEMSPAPRSIVEVTPSVWLSWRSATLARVKWPGQVNSARALLLSTPGVPEATRLAMRRRNAKPKKRFVYDAYSPAEFKTVKAAAWRTVEAAAVRIRESTSDLASYRASIASGKKTTEYFRSRGALLDHLAVTGDLPRDDAGNLLPLPVGALEVDGDAKPWHALFLTPEEVFSLMVLFAAVRGYNASTIERLTAVHQRPDGDQGPVVVRNVDMKKGRRGVGAQHMNDNLVGRRRGSAEAVYQLGLELTQPARDALASLGHPTQRLLVMRAHKSTGDPGSFIAQPQKGPISRTWASKYNVRGDDGELLSVSLQRLRLTEQVLNGQPRQNTQEVHDNIYVLREHRVHEESVAVILEGQQDALDHARATVQMRSWNQAKLAAARKDPAGAAMDLGVKPEKVKLLVVGALDTAVGGCLDFDHSPMSGGSTCSASFLLCLACPNAIATPDHLPRLVCLHEALTTVASAVSSAVWEADYAVHFARLESLLHTRTTTQEREAAAKRLTPSDRAAIEALLLRKFDI